MRADRILVVKDGQIIEDGSHDGLIRRRGKYHDMWSKQIFGARDTENSNDSSLKKSKPQLAASKKTIDNLHVEGHAKGKCLMAEVIKSNSNNIILFAR